MGYAGSLQKMVDECIEMCCTDLESSVWDTVEMTVLSAWVHKYLEDSSFVKLDTGCEIFWVTTGDDENYFKALESKGKFYNSITKTYPLIFHLVGPPRKRIDEGLERAIELGKQHFKKFKN